MFIFKNISSDDMGVVVEEETNILGKASQRYNKYEFEGRNGAFFDTNGYAVVEKTLKIQILDLKKIDLIMGWLDGIGILEYNGRITKARFYNEINPTRIASIRIAEVSFIRDPFWNKKRDDFVNIEDIIFNEGNIYSEPIFLLRKNQTNDVDVSIGNVRFKYHFKGEESVEINSEEKTVLYKELNRNRQIEIGYEFPILLPGENKVIIHSGDCELFVKRKDRWL